MRAAVFHGPNQPLVIEDVPTPAPGNGEIRVKVAGCGVCHTDLHYIDRGVPTFKKPPLILGHENGLVDALTEGAMLGQELDRHGGISCDVFGFFQQDDKTPKIHGNRFQSLNQNDNRWNNGKEISSTALVNESSDNKQERLVFLSHSAVDTWVAEQIASKIKKSGAIPFLDEAEIDVGADFEEDILSFLERADELVVLLTPWALKRPYIWAELGAAWGRRIPIVVLNHGLTATELQSKPDIPILLKKRNILPLNEIDTYLVQLKKRVESDSNTIDEVKQ